MPSPFDPTPPVTSSRGAPMGRHGGGALANLDLTSEPLEVRHCRLDRGGYDRGGAYWGLGQALYAVTDADGDSVYFRAADDDAALAHVRAESPEDDTAVVLISDDDDEPFGEDVEDEEWDGDESEFTLSAEDAEDLAGSDGE